MFDGVVRTLSWDDEDRLVASDATPLSVYNGDGARVKRGGVWQRRAGSSVTSPLLSDGPNRYLVPGLSERTGSSATSYALHDRQGTANHHTDGTSLTNTVETDAPLFAEADAACVGESQGSRIVIILKPIFRGHHLMSRFCTGRMLLQILGTESRGLLYPDHKGRAGIARPVIMEFGDIVGRVGPATGRFVSFPAQQARAMLSLNPDRVKGEPLTFYQVEDEFGALLSQARDWFGQPGGGWQIELSKAIEELPFKKLWQRARHSAGCCRPLPSTGRLGW